MCPQSVCQAEDSLSSKWSPRCCRYNQQLLGTHNIFGSELVCAAVSSLGSSSASAKLSWPRLTRVEGPSGKMPSRGMRHCCFTNPPSAGYHINLGCLTEVICSYLGIIFTGVNPGFASPQVGIPLFYLKNQTELSIPL